MCIVSVAELAELLKNKKVKVLEATLAPLVSQGEMNPNCKEFFQIATRESKCPNYGSEHIPGAVEFNLNVASPTGKFARFDMYPPHIFQSFLESLGLTAGDRIVLYSRGPFGGMLFASRAHWLLKYYGIDSSVLDGGYGAWKSAGRECCEGNVEVKLGSWNLGLTNKDILITFEEMDAKNAEGENMFDNLDKINFLDCRPAEQFSGIGQTKFEKNATGSRLHGSRSLPVSKICCDSGMQSKEMIEQAILSANLAPGAPVISSCITGLQASVLFLAMERIGMPAKVFNGSMMEIMARASHLINEKD